MFLEIPVKRWTSSVLALVLLVSHAASGCSSDDGPEAAAGAGGSSGTSDGGGRGGSGGSGAGGRGGRGGSGGSANPDASDGSAVTCSGVACEPNLTPPCCTAPGTGEPGNPLELVGRAAGRCGTDLSEYDERLAGICLQLNQPGAVDPACPEVPGATPGQPPAPGCCTDEGFCGAWEPALPLGCYYAGTRGAPCGTRDAGADGSVPEAGVGD